MSESATWEKVVGSLPGHLLERSNTATEKLKDQFLEVLPPGTTLSGEDMRVLRRVVRHGVDSPYQFAEVSDLGNIFKKGGNMYHHARLLRERIKAGVVTVSRQSPKG